MYRGMCTDVWDGSPKLEGGAGNHGEGAEEGSFDLGRVWIEDVKDAYGGLLATFEDVSGKRGCLPLQTCSLTTSPYTTVHTRCTSRREGRLEDIDNVDRPPRSDFAT